MNYLATAAGQAVENINGIPAPIALALTIAGCAVAVFYVVFTVVKDYRKDLQRPQPKK